MVCKKCKKEYLDEYMFCPYCGKKNENKEFAKYTNGDFIANCSMNELKEAVQKENIMIHDIDEMFNWLHSLAKKRECYGVFAKWNRHTYAADGSPIVFEECGFIDFDGFSHLVKDEKCDICNASIEKKEVSKNDIKKLGVSLFNTYEECKSKIDEIYVA